MFDECDDSDHEKIYYDFVNNEFSDPEFMQAKWGDLDKRPLDQDEWENMVKKEVHKITNFEQIAASCGDDKRPKLYDHNSGRHVLVDTGACRSIWPRSDFPQAKIDIDFSFSYSQINFFLWKSMKNSEIKSRYLP